jgi:hypothetical protein
MSQYGPIRGSLIHGSRRGPDVNYSRRLTLKTDASRTRGVDAGNARFHNQIEPAVRHRSTTRRPSTDEGDSMQNAASRASPSPRLVDERQFLGRVAFWLVVYGLWVALDIPWLLRKLRARYS